MKSDKNSITEMFDSISESYDHLNHLLSLGIDRMWRRKTAKAIGRNHPDTILDIATGTADMAIALAKRCPDASIYGIDRSEKMIAIGNLTGDPVLKTNEETGKPYAIMRIASDRRYKSPDGEKLTDFISIKVRGVLAERCAEFARKGCKIAASGDFETITFAEEPERQPGFLLKATEVEFLSPRKELDDAAELPAAA